MMKHTEDKGILVLLYHTRGLPVIDYIMKFYFTITVYDNKMYYLYGKINKAVDASLFFVRISLELVCMYVCHVCFSAYVRILKATPSTSVVSCIIIEKIAGLDMVHLESKYVDTFVTS